MRGEHTKQQRQKGDRTGVDLLDCGGADERRERDVAGDRKPEDAAAAAGQVRPATAQQSVT